SNAHETYRARAHARRKVAFRLLTPAGSGQRREFAAQAAGRIRARTFEVRQDALAACRRKPAERRDEERVLAEAAREDVEQASHVAPGRAVVELEHREDAVEMRGEVALGRPREVDASARAERLGGGAPRSEARRAAERGRW